MPFWRQTRATARGKKISIHALPKTSALWDKCILYKPKIFGDIYLNMTKKRQHFIAAILQYSSGESINAIEIKSRRTTLRHSKPRFGKAFYALKLLHVFAHLSVPPRLKLTVFELLPVSGAQIPASVTSPGNSAGFLWHFNWHTSCSTRSHTRTQSEGFCHHFSWKK